MVLPLNLLSELVTDARQVEREDDTVEFYLILLLLVGKSDSALVEYLAFIIGAVKEWGWCYKLTSLLCCGRAVY